MEIARIVANLMGMYGEVMAQHSRPKRVWSLLRMLRVHGAGICVAWGEAGIGDQIWGSEAIQRNVFPPLRCITRRS